ncbi:MAG: NAD(P)/FAD-dependent oxidoreductase [Pseudomonadota bacterium]
MNRRDFIKLSQLLGLALPATPLLSACGGNQLRSDDFTGSVLIIGAGPAGLLAGYLLQQRGIAFQILEASSRYGGRIKRSADFVDFPVPLGAEWIHVNADILPEIVNDDAVSIDTQTAQYDPNAIGAVYDGDDLTTSPVGTFVDSKFINSTWFDFYDQYIVPSIESLISYNQIVESIDYAGDQVTVQTQNQSYTADRVIVAVPVKMLQNGAIAFTPPLPSSKQSAIDDVTVWDGCKAFIEFKEAFYPTFVDFPISPASAGQKLYYDAAYGQNSARKVLGLFAVGTGTLPYVELSDEDLITYMLNELDEIFDGEATPNYVQHIFQNWNAEPFANGAYIMDEEDWRRVRTLGESVNGRLYFAGDAYTDGSDWSSVHTAARSARKAVDDISGG